jgi:hypothetical protein
MPDFLPVTILAVSFLAGLVLAPLGLPGLWLMVLGTVAYGWMTDFRTIGVVTLAVVVGLAVVGEVAEAWLGFASRGATAGRAGRGGAPWSGGSPVPWSASRYRWSAPWSAPSPARSPARRCSSTWDPGARGRRSTRGGGPSWAGRRRRRGRARWRRDRRRRRVCDPPRLDRLAQPLLLQLLPPESVNAPNPAAGMNSHRYRPAYSVRRSTPRDVLSRTWLFGWMMGKLAPSVSPPPVPTTKARIPVALAAPAPSIGAKRS